MTLLTVFLQGAPAGRRKYDVDYADCYVLLSCISS